ncbi:D-alanyl-D-alanine carboxypeptidase, partial [Bacillus tropicus]|nr:D-alanyl-D-alanine carboxypeptidase [Bacillus tropicus]
FTRDKKVVTKYWNLESKVHTDSIEDQVAYQKLRNNIDYFIRGIITSEEFRNKL